MKIYLCPALMDCLGFLILFAVTYGAGERGMSTGQCAWLGGLFQLVYMVASLAAGAILTRRNARALLLAGTAGAILLGSLSLLLEAFAPLLAALAVTAIAFAFFFNSFQTFMRGETPPGNLARTVGLYTLAWSTGSAAGLFASGYYYDFGRPALCGLTVLVGVIVLGILLFHRPRPSHQASADAQIDHGSARPVQLSYVWIGWLLIFTVTFVQRPLLTFYPPLCAKAHISAFLAGIPLALHMAVQGAVGFGLFPLKNLLYRKTHLILFQAGAAALLFLIWLRPSFLVCQAGISLLGIYAGFAFYAAVYYASNSPRSSFNIGINEFLVGLGSSAGIFAVERWMKISSDQSAMYLVGGLALLISAALQLLIAARRPGN
jgi:MFS family permease